MTDNPAIENLRQLAADVDRDRPDIAKRIRDAARRLSESVFGYGQRERDRLLRELASLYDGDIWPISEAIYTDAIRFAPIWTRLRDASKPMPECYANRPQQWLYLLHANAEVNAAKWPIGQRQIYEQLKLFAMDVSVKRLQFHDESNRN